MRFSTARLDRLGAVPTASATLSIATLTGTHSITAVYGGDGGHLPATSNKIEQVVNPIATTTTLTGDPNPSRCGQKVTLTARVNPPTATGQINWSGDVTGSATLVDGMATLSLVLGTGNKSFGATYKGDSCYERSSSAKLVQVVEPNPTTTSLSSDPNPSTCGQKVTLTATVTPAEAAGEVNFFDGSTQIDDALTAWDLSIMTRVSGPTPSRRFQGTIAIKRLYEKGVHAGGHPQKTSLTVTPALRCARKSDDHARVPHPTATGR